MRNGWGFKGITSFRHYISPYIPLIHETVFNSISRFSAKNTKGQLAGCPCFDHQIINLPFLPDSLSGKTKFHSKIHPHNPQ